MSLVFIANGAIKKGFDQSESDGFRVFAGTVIPLFVFIYIGQFQDITNTEFKIHTYFLSCSVIGYLVMNIIARIEDKILYYSLIALFCSSTILTIVYFFKNIDNFIAMGMVMGIAFGFLFYILLNGLDENKPVFSLLKIGYGFLSFWKALIPKRFKDKAAN